MNKVRAQSEAKASLSRGVSYTIRSEAGSREAGLRNPSGAWPTERLRQSRIGVQAEKESEEIKPKEEPAPEAKANQSQKPKPRHLIHNEEGPGRRYNNTGSFAILAIGFRTGAMVGETQTMEPQPIDPLWE